MTENRTQVPVVILTGFLGSGKTTLLNHLLRHSGDTRIGVIVNDFGAINVDALLVAQQTDETVELTNGCMCCTLGEGGIDDTIGRLAHAHSLIDVVVIEASGIAEPAEIAKLVLHSKNKYINYGGLVYIVDASEFQTTRQAHQSLDTHIAIADLLVLNKTDQQTQQTLADIQATCRSLNPHAPIVMTHHGVVDPALLYDICADTESQLRLGQLDTADHHAHLHHTYQSIEFSSDAPLNPRMFERFLRRPPAGVYRLKGYAYYGMKGYEQKYLVQLTGHHVDMQAGEWSHGEAPHTQLVLIGQQLDIVAVQVELEQCIDTAPDTLDPTSMVDILRLI